MYEARSLYLAGHSMETDDDAIHNDDSRLVNGLGGEALTIPSAYQDMMAFWTDVMSPDG